MGKSSEYSFLSKDIIEMTNKHKKDNLSIQWPRKCKSKPQGGKISYSPGWLESKSIIITIRILKNWNPSTLLLGM